MDSLINNNSHNQMNKHVLTQQERNDNRLSGSHRP